MAEQPITFVGPGIHQYPINIVGPENTSSGAGAYARVDAAQAGATIDR
jgi:hypothetical protein